MAIILSKVIKIIIITMTFGKFRLSQQMDTENMFPRVKRWQQGANAYLHSSTVPFNKPLTWLPGDSNQLSEHSKLEEAMLHFSYHTKQIWTQMNALRQENDKLKDDMLQLWSQNHQLKAAIINNQKNF